jgi:thioredoxin-like negative regulator of GroEL
MTTIINAKNHRKEVTHHKKPVLLSFTGDYGKGGISAFLLGQTINALGEELHGEIKVGVVRPDSKLMRKYNIRFLPTTLLIQHGKVTDRIIGNISREALLNVLQTS